MFIFGGEVTLRGGIISENKSNGVSARQGARVTVAEAEEDGLPQTVSKDNAVAPSHPSSGGQQGSLGQQGSDWRTMVNHEEDDLGDGAYTETEIIVIPQEKIHRDPPRV